MKHLSHVLLSTVLFALLPLVAGAQEAHDHSQMMAASEAADSTAEAAEGHAGCQDMMQMHQKMQEQMEAKDAELARLVEEMKSATSDAKVDAIAAALEELIDQHRSMHGMMMAHGTMPSMVMKKHQHMQSMGDGMDMSKCPMMEEMKMESGAESGEESGEDEGGDKHDEHHSN